MFCSVILLKILFVAMFDMPGILMLCLLCNDD